MYSKTRAKRPFAFILSIITILLLTINCNLKSDNQRSTPQKRKAIEGQAKGNKQNNKKARSAPTTPEGGPLDKWFPKRSSSPDRMPSTTQNPSSRAVSTQSGGPVPQLQLIPVNSTPSASSLSGITSTQSQNTISQLPETVNSNPSSASSTFQQEGLDNTGTQENTSSIEEEKIVPKKNKKLKVVLLKEGVLEFEAALKKQSAEVLTSNPTTTRTRSRQHEVNISPELIMKRFSIKEGQQEYKALFALEQSLSSHPLWLREIQTYCRDRAILALPLPSYQEEIKSGLVFVEVENRKFAYVFDRTGFFLLKRDAIEEKFGLITTLNSIKENTRIKSVSTVSRGFDSTYKYESYSIPRNKNHLPPHPNIRFTSMQVHHSSSNGSKDVDYSGPTALVYVPNSYTIDNYPETCRYLLNLYNKPDYKKTHPYVDNLIPLEKTSEIVKVLDQKMVDLLNNKASGWYLTGNIVIEYPEIEYYGLLWRKDKNNKEDLGTYPNLEELAERFENLDKYSMTKLKKNLKIQTFDNNKKLLKEWPIYKFLAADIEIEGEFYTLIDGKWHQVKKEYYEELNDCINIYFLGEKELPQLPPISKDLITAVQAKNSKERESYLEQEYCKSVAQQPKSNFLLMDRRLIKADPSPDPHNLNNMVEVCDLLYYDLSSRQENNTRYLIHIKDGTRASTFSHLLNQGQVPTTTILNNGNKRKQIQESYIKAELLETAVRFYNKNKKKHEKDLQHYINLVNKRIKQYKVTPAWIKGILDNEFRTNHKAESKDKSKLINDWNKDCKENREKAIQNLAFRLKYKIDKKYLESYKNDIEEYLASKDKTYLQTIISKYLVGDVNLTHELAEELNEAQQNTQKIISTVLPVENYCPDNFTVLYAFFHKDNREKLSDYLPFFSRESFKNALGNLTNARVNVKIKRIEKYQAPKKNKKDTAPIAKFNLDRFFNSQTQRQSQTTQEVIPGEEEDDIENLLYVSDTSGSESASSSTLDTSDTSKLEMEVSPTISSIPLELENRGGEKQYVYEELIDGSGNNCGFKCLEIGREEGLARLLSVKDNGNARQVVAEEIKSAYYQKELYNIPGIKEMEAFKRLVEVDQQQQRLEANAPKLCKLLDLPIARSWRDIYEHIKNSDFEYPKDPIDASSCVEFLEQSQSLDDAIRKQKEDLEEFAHDSVVYEAYFSDYLGNKEGMLIYLFDETKGQERKIKTTSFDLLARLLGKRLRIWGREFITNEKNEKKMNGQGEPLTRIVLQHEDNYTEGEVLNLLHTNYMDADDNPIRGGKAVDDRLSWNHYNLLHEQPSTNS